MKIPITPESVLENLAEAKYVSDMRLKITSPKFQEMLQDPSFAEKAERCVRKKIGMIEKGKIEFAGTSSYALALSAWRNAYTIITEPQSKNR